MELFALWIMFAFVGLVIGIKKGIHPVKALLGGIILGVLSPLMIFVSPESKKCDKCAEMVKLEASVCKHCGHQFVQKSA